jgi:hypothetical protein
VFNNRLHIVGGYSSGGQYLNDIWYSEDGAAWTQVTAPVPWAGRHRHAAAVFDDKLWVIAGNSGANCGDVWYCDTAYNWTMATDSAPWPHRWSAQAVVFDSSLWLVGGYSQSAGYRNDVWQTTNGSDWVELDSAAPWAARDGHVAAVKDGKVWVYGGGNQPDVWSTDGTGIAESGTPTASRPDRIATIARGVLFLPCSPLSTPHSLLSIDGRKVLDLHPGPNDVSRLAPGVYFVRAIGRELSAMSCQKVVLTR